ncbi:uncharacterized protein TNCV_2165311 [Trichonephila clavipes]|nr:uncharacterized protein TNCV_2165311 [Trichonephila clavipes]
MQFLKKEVEGEERIIVVVAFFGLGKNQEYKSLKKKQFSSENLRNKVPTAMGLLTSTPNSDVKKACIFCEVEKCRAVLKCLIYSKKHFPLMCDVLDSQKMSVKKKEKPAENEVNMTNFNKLSPKIFLQTLKAKLISDTKKIVSCEVIDILIGADVIGKVLTGRRKVLLSDLVTVETYLGWTLMGKVPHEEPSEENLAMTVLSLFVNEAEISNIWKLDLIGINDPVEKKSMYEIHFQTKKHFLETVTIDEEGRYEVCLPWSDDRSFLPDNLSLAKKRLNYTTAKLLAMNMYEKYENVIQSWLAEGIIEEIPKNEERLLKSFYVDNVVTSVDSKDQLNEFIANSKTLMEKGGFYLREWEWSGDCENDSKNETQVLGLIWNKESDTLRINTKW